MTVTLLAELDGSFDVERIDGYGLGEDVEVSLLARPGVKLIPRNPTAAPLVVAFTAFPGVRLRAGHWFADPFPSCGCDACDETADGEAIRLRRLIDDVVAGRFREEISLPLVGDGWQSWGFWSHEGRSSGRSRIDRERARAMLAAAGCRSIEWAAWTRRPS